MALANAPSKAVADQCQVVKTWSQSYRRVLTWFASRWRNHQPKRAEKPHSKFNAARRWTALLRGRRLRLSRRMASGSRQPPRGERQMSARERESGELPSPKFVLVQSQDWAGTFCFCGQPGLCPALTPGMPVLRVNNNLRIGIVSQNEIRIENEGTASEKDLPLFWFPAKTASTVNSNHFRILWAASITTSWKPSGGRRSSS